MQTETMHIGRKISRIRELRGMKQETLAAEMGVSQQAISKLEQSEHVDDDRLQLVAEKLGVSVEALKNFNEDGVVNLLNDIHNNHFDNSSIGMVYHQYINQAEKIVELYERLLQTEREKIALLERMLNERK